MIKLTKNGNILKLEEMEPSFKEPKAIQLTWLVDNQEDLRKAEKLIIQFLTRDNCKFGTKVIDTCDTSVINTIDDDYNEMED